MTDVTSGDDQPLSVADHRLGKTRVLSQQCDTCIFRPGNKMHLQPGRLADMVRQARAREGFIVCHQTLPYGDHPDHGPAVCRGFHDRYDTQALQVARRLWGIVEVPPPSSTPTLAKAASANDPTAPSTAKAPAPQSYTTPTRPLVFVDVDGVLNPMGSRQGAYGYRPHRFHGRGPDGQPASGIVWLHPEHGSWLQELADHGAQLMWATSWGQLANTWIAPRLGLPGTWPVVDLAGYGGVRWGHATKLDPIIGYAEGRPLAVINDEIGGKDPHWAQERTTQGSPTLLVEVNPYQGLTRTDLERVLSWLNDPTATRSPDPR